MRSKPVILVLFVHLCLSLLSFSLAISSGDGYTITGRVKIQSMVVKAFGTHAKSSNVKVILNGGQRVTFLRHDGSFSFYNVPAGTHLIEVDALGYYFSPVRVDVSARFPGKIQAALTENRRGLGELTLEPMRVEQYYEININWLVSYPEEMRRAQEEMRNQGVPSLSSLLPGAARST
ncbi:er membrane protein complex subunit 7 like protein [Quercus suber]|uniref:Er membrane protein complex subunit 7 like protein n=1 Tax=Quercus suber TaxID=58331 RepID=A0AAW0LEG1_QUESU